jgi:hypothetical protein
MMALRVLAGAVGATTLTVLGGVLASAALALVAACGSGRPRRARQRHTPVTRPVPRPAGPGLASKSCPPRDVKARQLGNATPTVVLSDSTARC